MAAGNRTDAQARLGGPPSASRDQRVRAVELLFAVVVPVLVAAQLYRWWSADWVELDANGGQTPPAEAVRFLVDVNRAEWPELAQLPGIGRVLAQRIVDRRQQAGPFRRVEDLRQVRGLGPKTLDRIRPYLLPLDPAAPADGQPADAADRPPDVVGGRPASGKKSTH